MTKHIKALEKRVAALEELIQELLAPKLIEINLEGLNIGKAISDNLQGLNK